MDSLEGRVVLVDLPTGEVHRSPVRSDFFPEGIAVGESFAYLAAPSAGLVVEVDARTK